MIKITIKHKDAEYIGYELHSSETVLVERLTTADRFVLRPLDARQSTIVIGSAVLNESIIKRKEVWHDN